MTETDREEERRRLALEIANQLTIAIDAIIDMAKCGTINIDMADNLLSYLIQARRTARKI